MYLSPSSISSASSVSVYNPEDSMMTLEVIVVKGKGGVAGADVDKTCYQLPLISAEAKDPKEIRLIYQKYYSACCHLFCCPESLVQNRANHFVDDR